MEDEKIKKKIEEIKTKLNSPIVYLDQTSLEQGLAETAKDCKWALEQLKGALDSREHTEYWYMTRWERLKEYAKEKGLHHDVCAIMANGTLDPHEPPTYAQQYNTMKYKMETALKEKDKLQESVWELEQRVNDLEEELNEKNFRRNDDQ